MLVILQFFSVMLYFVYVSYKGELQMLAKHITGITRGSWIGPSFNISSRSF